MSIAEIKEQLHSYIEQADDKKIQGLFLFVEDEIKGKNDFQLSNDEIAFLDAERAKHISGESKSYNWEEAKKIIRSKK